MLQIFVICKWQLFFTELFALNFFTINKNMYLSKKRRRGIPGGAASQVCSTRVSKMELIPVKVAEVK